jgi:hypothetical protein
MPYVAAGDILRIIFKINPIEPYEPIVGGDPEEPQGIPDNMPYLVRRKPVTFRKE